MYCFLRFGVPLTILAIAITIASLIPTSQTIQIITAALLGGIPMWLIGNLRHIPNVVIEELGQEVTYVSSQTRLSCWTSGVIVNKSSTGEGEIKNLLLRISLDNESPIDVPARHGEPDIIGFRLKPNGLFPDRMIQFELSPIYTDIEVAGKPAEIYLDVVGQKVKLYKVKMMSKA